MPFENIQQSWDRLMEAIRERDRSLKEQVIYIIKPNLFGIVRSSLERQILSLLAKLK